MQAAAGQLTGRPSSAGSAAYDSDPIELDAFKEGITVADSFPGPVVAYDINHGLRVRPEEPNPYIAWSGLEVSKVADIRIHRQTTLGGYFRAFTARLR